MYSFAEQVQSELLTHKMEKEKQVDQYLSKINLLTNVVTELNNTIDILKESNKLLTEENNQIQTNFMKELHNAKLITDNVIRKSAKELEEENEAWRRDRGQLIQEYEVKLQNSSLAYQELLHEFKETW
jgi:predicted RNase H-like nuclease (RuvC/YqgF family)